MLCWARRLEVQRAQKVMLDARKESRVSCCKSHKRQSNATEAIRKGTQSNCRYFGNMHSVQSMAGVVLDAAQLIISSKCGEARGEQCEEMATENNTE